MAQTPAAHQAEVEARVPFAPQPVAGSDGLTHLGYELHITNFYASTGPLRLTRVAVFADGAHTPLATFAGAEVDSLRGPHDAAKDAAQGVTVEGVTIEGGRRTVLFLWIALPKGAPKPAVLRHELTFETKDGKTERADNVRIPVDRTPPIVIGPPLRGGRWLADEGPGNHLSHHWGSLVAVDGQVTIPQRFATDWFGLDARGLSVQAPGGEIAKTTDADWVGFGADVLAVADGVVRDARDGVPDGTPLAPQDQPDDLTARTVYGNFVVLEIAPHVFAHYAHLRNGSVKVKVGDRVRLGAVIGSLGQTGNAGAPHLHFQLADLPTFEESEGLPFVFRAFDLLGSGTIDDTLGTAGAAGVKVGPPTARRGELPLDGAVVGFPGR